MHKRETGICLLPERGAAEVLQVGRDGFKMAVAKTADVARGLRDQRHLRDTADGPGSPDMGAWRKNKESRGRRSSNPDRDYDYS